ncbi:MAG: amidohydrolase family protein [Candidatus Hydrogenedentes bacterium]|nr:amidohydrolase family protein [Candidatus Hydrogenedentota bacterium]
MTDYRPLFGSGIIDCNSFIGHWPFRRLRRNTAAELVAMMDQFGIWKSCVASAEAILYRDSHEGNRALYEQTREHADRFWLYATINPMYAGWERDLAQCVDWGFRAVRLYPVFHNYRLDSPEADRIVRAAHEAGLPVAISCRVEDVRQRHWMDRFEDVDPLDVLGLAEAHPDTRFILMESLLGWPHDADEWRRLRDTQVYVEMSRMTALMERPLEIMTWELGDDRVLFGTGFPFKTPSPAFLELQVLDADEDAKARIAGENVRRLMDPEAGKG